MPRSGTNCATLEAIEWPRAPRYRVCSILMILVLSTACGPRQRIDVNFEPRLANPPAYTNADGPTLWIDEAHRNIVATRGRYRPMVDVLELDGYVVRPLRAPFSRDALRDKRLLIVGNAVTDPRREDAETPRSAFELTEIESLVGWVSEGGSLLLLVDHMPLSGAASDLAHEFGFHLNNGFVIDWNAWDDTVFLRADGTLLDHSLTRGRSATENVDSAAAFYGSAFQATGADPVLVVGPGFESFLPDEPWRIDENTPRIPAEGWWMGATREFGRGKLAVFSDATMFSAQISKGGNPMGMNASTGRENLQLLLNVVHWLDGLYE